MVKKSEYWQQEAQRLTLVLTDIFEVLPQAGEEMALTWQKVGYIRALLFKGLIGDGWLDLSDAQCNETLKAALPHIRKNNARLLVGGES